MSKEEDINQIYLDFVLNLEKVYGKFDSVNKKFESTSNSKIARDLFNSDSQFSRLINNTASEGELIRALGNINRFLEVTVLKSEISKKEKDSSKVLTNKFWILLILIITTIAISSFLFLNFKNIDSDPSLIDYSKKTKYDMLQWGFENNYVKPYLKLKELPEDCYYPCYKYQGKWKLKEEYKVPFYRERNGFHYVAKEVVMYSRCMDEKKERGESFEGYEYQKHEIWYDKRETPIDSFLSVEISHKLKESYAKMDFEDNSEFIKIAYVHTFFRTEFTIDGDKVYRSGKAIGRDIEFVSMDILKEQSITADLLNELKSETSTIAKNLLKDFSKPINCIPSAPPSIDFNKIKQGDELIFDCQFSIGRFVVDYTKSYLLEDQYISTICR